MNRARFAFAATLVGASCRRRPRCAQAPQAPPMTSVLAGKKFTPPIKGEAEVEFTQPVTKAEKRHGGHTIKVRNTCQRAGARLTIAETWYDKGGAIVDRR